MSVSYRARVTKTGKIEVYRRSFDGNDTDIDNLAFLDVAEAEGLIADLSGSIHDARVIERQLLEKRREDLSSRLERLEAEMRTVTSEIEAIDRKQSVQRELPLVVDGTRVVVA